MKKISSLVITGLLASPFSVFAQTAPAHIKLLMDATEERHDAVEEMMSSVFTMSKKYHDEIMAVSGATFYTVPNDDRLRTAYTNDVWDDFQTPQYEFDLVADDYDLTAKPTMTYCYKIVDGDAAATAANLQAKQQLKAARVADALQDLQDEQAVEYPFPDGYKDTESETVNDIIAYTKAYWTWRVNARKTWIEDQEKIDPFDQEQSDFQYDPGEHPRYEQENLDHEAEWQASQDRKIARLQRIYDFENGAQIQGVPEANYDNDVQDIVDQHQEDVDDWEEARDTWWEGERLAAATAYRDAVNAYKNGLASHANSSAVRNAAEKMAYLESLPLNFVTVYPSVSFKGLPDTTCGAVFQKAELKWKHEVPTTMEEQIAVLNQISFHLDRLSNSYLSIDLDLAKDEGDGIHASSLDNSHDEFRSIGMVSVSNYRSKILAIQRRLLDMKQLRWPMLKREYDLEDSIKSTSVSSGSRSLAMGESGSHELTSPYDDAFTPYESPVITFYGDWKKQLDTGASSSLNALSSDHFPRWEFANGHADDFVCNAPTGWKLYLLSNQKNNGVFHYPTASPSLDQSVVIHEIQSKASGYIGDGNVNFQASVEVEGEEFVEDANLDDYQNKINEGNHIRDNLELSWARNYPGGTADLGLLDNLSVSVNLEEDGGNSNFTFYDVENSAALKPHLPSGQFDLDDRKTDILVLEGRTMVVCEPQFSVEIPENFTFNSDGLPPSASFSTDLNGLPGFVFPLPVREQLGAGTPYLSLALFFDDGNIIYSGGLWRGLNLHGSRTGLIAKPASSLPAVQQWWKVVSGVWQTSETIANSSTSFNSAMPIGSIEYDGGKVEMEGLSPYRFKIKYYVTEGGQSQLTRTYEVKIENFDSGQLLSPTFPGVDYPSGFETVTVLEDGKPWARAVSLGIHSAATPLGATGEEEAYRVEYYNDDEDIEHRRLYREYYASTIGYDVLHVNDLHETSQDKLSHTYITRYLPRGRYLQQLSYEGRQIAIHRHQEYSTQYLSADFMTRPFGNNWSLLGTYFSIPGDHTIDYSDAYLADEDTKNWAHLPLYRYPEKLVLEDAENTPDPEWSLHGDEMHYDREGNSILQKYKVVKKTPDMTADITGEDTAEISQNGNEFNSSNKILGNEMSSVSSAFENGLSKVTTTIEEVDTVVEYYTDDQNNGLPWRVKSVETQRGKTTYTYDVDTDGKLKVIETYDPEGDDSKTVTTTEYNKYGSLLTQEVKSGSAIISKITASEHSATTFHQPKKVVKLAGGITREINLEYHPDGSLKKFMENDGTGDDDVVNEYVWDILGRLKSGTKFDGKDYVPDYSVGFKASKVDFDGNDFATTTDKYGKLKKTSHDVGPGFAVEQDANDPNIYTSEITDEGRSAESNFHPGGLPDKVFGGIGSPGVKYEYGTATVDEVNCITLQRTLLKGNDAESGTWSTDYYDGYGRLVRRAYPGPMGDKTVYTDYSYDPANRKVTISPPSPSKDVTIQYSEDWKTTTVKRGARTLYKAESSVEDGVLTGSLKKGGLGREVYSSVSNLADSEITTKVNNRNPYTTSVAADGKRITVDGPNGADLKVNYNKYGVEDLSGNVSGRDFSIDVTRNASGEISKLEVDPPGPAGAVDFNYNTDTWRLDSITGSGENISLDYNFLNGREKVSVNNLTTGEFAHVSRDAHGHLRDFNLPDKPALIIDGDALDGTFKMGYHDPVTGGIEPASAVEYNVGPDQSLLALKRADGSGVSYVYRDNGELEEYTRFDAQNTLYNFIMLRDEDTGYPKGFTGPDCALLITPDDEGRHDYVSYTSRDILGNNLTHICDYGSYFDERPLQEVYGGVLAGYEVKRSYYPVSGDLARVELYSGGTLVHAVDYALDGAGRLDGVTASVGKTFSSDYDYTPGYLQKTTSGSVEATRNILADGTARLAGLTTTAGASAYGADFTHNPTTKKRTGLNLTSTGRSAMNWTYGFTGDQLQTADLQNGVSYTYNHDVMGNRADTNPNEVNEYSVIQVQGADDYTVRGKVQPGASVTISVNGAPAENVAVAPDGSFTKTYDAPAQGLDPVTIPIVVTGTLPGAGANGAPAVAKENRTITLSPTSWNVNYGAHGALANDWRWVYKWNSEGRLNGMETRGGVLAHGLPNLRLRFTYDDRDRRILKTVDYLTADGSNVTRTITTRFVYDNWNLIGEFISDSEKGDSTRFYTWGQDLNGSLEETGGVGALLAVHQDGVSYVPVYDANGNITALCKASDGTEVAHWSRGPFGEPISSSGNTELCPFGFATHYTDAETGLVYFGYRYYSPETGRWLSREPLGEFESFNLYAYCHNDPINNVDVLGLAIRRITIGDRATYVKMFGEQWGNYWYDGFERSSDIYTNLKLRGGVSYEVGMAAAARSFLKNHSDQKELRANYWGPQTEWFRSVKLENQFNVAWGPRTDKTTYRMDLHTGWRGLDRHGKHVVNDNGIRGSVYLVPIWRNYTDKHPIYWMAADTAEEHEQLIRYASHLMSLTKIAGLVKQIGDIAPFGQANRVVGSVSKMYNRFKQPVKPNIFSSSPYSGMKINSWVGKPFSAYTGKGNTGITGNLYHDGMISFSYKAGPNTPRGRQMFNEMLDYFGRSNVKGIRGNWSKGNALDKMDTNYRVYKQMLEFGFSPKTAAALTPTGRSATHAGYTTIKIIEDSAHQVLINFLR